MVRSSGLSDSEAVRTALREAAARRRLRSSIAEEVRTLMVSARPASFRPTVELDGQQTRVLAEQTTVVDPQRLGPSAGRLDGAELRAVDEALTLLLGF